MISRLSAVVAESLLEAFAVPFRLKASGDLSADLSHGSPDAWRWPVNARPKMIKAEMLSEVEWCSGVVIGAKLMA